ncbi:MAG: Abi family protein [Desulfobacteraceae bacterium]|nr:Abi family protein [Desulfobacteraceae bacterium]
MIIPDKNRAERKLSQIGYYRLSGFWYPCREFKKDARGQQVINKLNGKPVREDTFQKNINFNDIIQLYLFDKKLRLLMLDAIERIEIQIRSVIAHEVGYHDPLAYENQVFMNPKKCEDWYDPKRKKIRNFWKEWRISHSNKIKASREECIKWHLSNSKSIPIWVAVEAWDFGTMSKYYENLKRKYQNKISSRLGISNPVVLKKWLQEINILRNRCAHHTRIWNQSFRNPLPVLYNPYFNALNLDRNALKRNYGMICVLWFLVKRIGPSSSWLNYVTDLIDSKPSMDSCPNTAMGFPDNNRIIFS